MSAPGARLRALASLVCRAETLERLVDPVVADLRLECANAVHESVWRQSAIRCRGYFAFWGMAVSYARVALVTTVRAAMVQDDGAVGRFLAVAVVPPRGWCL